mgnify:CR=1 FL=1
MFYDSAFKLAISVAQDYLIKTNRRKVCAMMEAHRGNWRYVSRIKRFCYIYVLHLIAQADTTLDEGGSVTQNILHS